MTIQDFLTKYHTLGKDSITEEDLEKALNFDDFSEIFNLADKLCRESFHNIVDIRAILEFSNYCKRSCFYCGLNKENQKIKRYRMPIDEIVEVSLLAYKAGYKTIVLQSGEDNFYTLDKIVEIITKIRKESPMFITLSCGERNLQEYKEFKKAGANRYLLKHETANTELYSHLHPCGTFKNRITCLKEIKKAGLETGSGFMIGLPSQDYKTLAKDLLLLKELSCDMAGIGPFIPCDNTKLANEKAGDPLITRKCVALARLLLPKSKLPATTSLGVIDSKAKNSVFSCGANVIMRKVTPQKYEEYYKIYPNNIQVNDIYKERLEIENLITSLNKIPR